jgi:hypothetical protein
LLSTSEKRGRFGRTSLGYREFPARRRADAQRLRAAQSSCERARRRTGCAQEFTSELPHHACHRLLSADAELQRRGQSDTLRVRWGAKQEHDTGTDSGGRHTCEHCAGEGKRLASRHASVRTIDTAIGILSIRTCGNPRGNGPARAEAADAERDERWEAEAEQTKRLRWLWRSQGEPNGREGRLLHGASANCWDLGAFRSCVRGVEDPDQAGTGGNPVSSFGYQYRQIE